MTDSNLRTMTSSASGRSRSPRAPTHPPASRERKRALDPFFIFTYSLLALAAGLQLFLMVWMDLF